MPLAIQTGLLPTGDQKVHQFPNKVRVAGVAMQSYTLGYNEAAETSVTPANGESETSMDDHHVKEVSASALITTVNNNEVTVKVEGKISDDSGNSGGGKIGYAVIVETD